MKKSLPSAYDQLNTDDNITFFVSSTFADMQIERDLLHTQIAPATKAFANQQGRTVNFIDFRWGIDTSSMSEEESMDRILSVCMDTIDACKGYMIVLLGNRYGTIPGGEKIKKSISKYSDFQLDNDEISITDLEIKYGILSCPENAERVLFYFRKMEGEIPEEYQSENRLAEEKLRSLKSSIHSLPGVQIREYSVHYNVETKTFEESIDFVERVKSDISILLNNHWNSHEVMTE